MNEIKPELYKEVFEDDRRGAAILADLERKFTHPPVVKGGIDAVLQTYYREGMRQVVYFINSQIARAHGNEGDSEFQVQMEDNAS